MLSLSQAAKRTGKSKSVISRALEKDKIKAVKNDDGTYEISPADLFAVFPEHVPEPAKQHTSVTNNTPPEPQHNTSELLERARLQAETTAAKQQADDLRATIADLQTRLDNADSDRRRLEDDRRNANDNATRQIDQLTAIMALKEKTLQDQTTALEHHRERPAEPAEPAEKPSLFKRVFSM